VAFRAPNQDFWEEVIVASLTTRFLRVWLFIGLLPALTGFRVGNTTVDLPLSDPASVLTWNTFLGRNNGTDYGMGITVDGSGYIYVTGISNAAWGTPVRDYTGASDTFVAKFDASGQLIWNTFLGSSVSTDYGEEIIVDGSGNVYVTGLTDVSFGSGTWGNPIRPFMGQGDAFVAKLDSSGNLLWNTFLGSSAWDWGKGLILAPDGHVYVTGSSSAVWGDVIVRGFTAIEDAFVAKLDLGGNLLWTSFFGGPGFDEGSGITRGSNGNLYVTGFSTATTGSAGWGNPLHDYSGGGDAFVVTVDSNGNLIWNTFLGGNGYEYGTEAAVDGTGKVYVTGLSNAMWGNPVRDYAAGIDAFAASLDSSGNLLWNTFLGGNGADEGHGIAVDQAGNAHIAGYSGAAWGTPLRAYIALDDGFEAELDSAGNIVSHWFLGDTGYDYGYGLAVDNDGNVLVTGSSTATWGTPVSEYTPPTDAFIAKLDTPPLVISTSLSAVMDSGPGSFTVTFNEELSNPPGNTAVDDATNPNNYLLVEKDTNASADTVSCAAGVSGDDTQITVASVTYNASALTSTVTLAGKLSAGKYRLFVCGTTSIVDPGNTALAGNGITSGTDYMFDFAVNSAATSPSTGTSLPRTGFTPRIVTTIPSQPADKAYSALGDLWLEIPSQGLKTSIVGVPQSHQNWDVTWLGNDVGWLHGTAFPTWDGNSVLTGHAYNANGLPGPFATIKNLKYGDRLIVHLAGEKYVFEVQSTRLLRPTSTDFAFEHLEEYSYLTLITCQVYNPISDSYLFRRIVRAVLVEVELE
jgi:LPXTG-site transpeptidase (sortase) family protein